MVPLVKVFMPPREKLEKALIDVLYGGNISEGEEVYKFEDEFSEKYCHPNVLAVSSGTAALHMAMISAGVGYGDEVISTPMTAEPTNIAIMQAGAKVVWADVDPENGNIAADSIEEQITDRTKAVICVHYAGYPCELKKIRNLCDQRGIVLIEDCAHALGASYGGKPVGSFGDYAIFSFQAIKHITSIDGGILVVKDASKIDELKELRWFGLRKGLERDKQNIKRIGYKYNQNNVHAVLGRISLGYASELRERHVANCKKIESYVQQLSVQGLKAAKVYEGGEASYWLSTMLSDNSSALIQEFNKYDIGASKLHVPNNRHDVFEYANRELPGLKAFYEKLLHVPCGWWVTDKNMKVIKDVLSNVAGK